MAFIPIRFLIFFLGLYGCALVYMHRAGMSVAIVSMTSDSTSSEADFDWDGKLQGIILGAQFYLYIFVPTIAGRATDALGARWIAFVGVLGPCVLAAITPVITQHLGAWALIVNRVLLGGFHGCIYPALFSLYVKWFPIQERAIANGGLVFGGSMGSTIMNILAGYLCDTEFGWPMVFYVLALFHVPWLVLWFLFSTNEPARNRHISDKERLYIEAHVQEKVISDKVKAPWLRMFVSVPVICSLITKLCSGFGYFLLITKMPSYLSTIFGIQIFQNGSFNAATNFSNGMASLLAPPIANLMIARLGMRRVLVRKLFQSIAMFGPAICLGLIPAMGDNSTPVICLLVGAMLLYGFFTAGEWTIVSEYAPNFAGTVFGFANILAFASGVVAPYVVGVMLDADSANSRQQWNTIFYITVGIYVFGGITFLIFGTDQQQDWDRDAVQCVKQEFDQETRSEISQKI